MKSRLLLLAAILATILTFIIPASPAAAGPAHDDQITRLYLTVLGRTPDAEGHAYWSARRVNGESLHDLARVMLDSPEVDETTSGDIVVDAYVNAFDRLPDADGYQFWSSRRAWVAVVGISESVEHQQSTGTLPPPVGHPAEVLGQTLDPVLNGAPELDAPVHPDGWVDAGNGVYVPQVLIRIRYCESTDNYQAANRWSSARGGYQFLTSSWAAYGHDVRYGVNQAHKASPAQQDEAALITWQADGTRPWAASQHCWG